jgi:putative transcriptional regulator
MREELFNQLVQSMREAAAHARGETVPGLRVHHVQPPEPLDLAAIRGRTGLSREAFARRIGVSMDTLRDWENGRRKPEGPARVLLAMLSRNPRVLEETLGEAAE